MRTQASQSSIQDDRTGIAEVLQSLDPRLSFAIGLLGCALVAYYIPSILIALTGVWVNNLTMMDALLISMVVLIVQNLIGNRIKKILLVGIVFAVLFNLYAVVVMVHKTANPTFHDWWMMFFYPTVTYPLNAWLLLRFKVIAGLD